VQVDGHVTIGAGHLDHIRDQARGDRHARLVFFIRTSVTQVGDHGGDTPCRVPFERVEHDQQFHDVVADRRGHGLDQEHILSAHAFFQSYEDVLV